MSGHNFLFVMSDEHLREAAGCYGSKIVQTPNLDRLVKNGTRFTQAYTPSPICVPARASLATGQYVHQCRYWSNAQAYDGRLPSWGHRLIENGNRCVSIGKLHYQSSENDNGFDEEHYPLHVRDGQGWVRGLLRKNPPAWGKASEFADQIGPGECEYTQFDCDVCDKACHWLRHEANKHKNKPWALFVSFVSPHYPLIVPKKYYDLYPEDQMILPRLASEDELPQHPVVQGVRSFMNYDDYFDDDKRRKARAAYFGLCSFLDDNIGKVLTTLEDSGQAKNTTVLYTSDHGELLGNHGMWTKSAMYEEAAAIPMIISGPDIPTGKVCNTASSLVDCYPTIIENAGLALSKRENQLPGVSLFRIAKGEKPDRTLLSEYHDGGSITGKFMIRHEHWKYIHYPGYPPQLFDLKNDPWEANDLGESNKHKGVLTECEKRLREVVDPDATNELAFGDQQKRIEELGGRDAILTMEDYDHTPVTAS